MSADVLRRAAASMRQRANLGIPSFWTAAFIEGAFLGHPHVNAGTEGVAATITKGAEHIASWHPAVALAVADALDFEADYVTQHGPSDVTTTNLLAVARAYLEEAS